MILNLLARPVCRDVRHLTTSITSDNAASWRLFGHVASALGATLEEWPWFRSRPHLAGRHPTEHLVAIGPFEAGGHRR
jgi:L-2,4-diaminobutyric acid acetyltransferase